MSTNFCDVQLQASELTNTVFDLQNNCVLVCNTSQNFTSPACLGLILDLKSKVLVSFWSRENFVRSLSCVGLKSEVSILFNSVLFNMLAYTVHTANTRSSAVCSLSGIPKGGGGGLRGVQTPHWLVQ